MSHRNDNHDASIAVIGAGIVGLASAFRLAQQQQNVVLIDRNEPGKEASFGNAGHVATEQIFPLASPSTLLSAPKLLLRGDRPLSIRREYALRILPWLLRFSLAAMPASFRRNTAALSALQSDAMSALRGLLTDAKIGALLCQRGHMIIVESDRSIAAARNQLSILQERGIAVRWLEPEAVAQQVPLLVRGIAGALYFTGTGHVTDPYRVCKGLHGAFLEAGGRFVRGEVGGLTTEADNGLTVRLGIESLRARKVVVAAGAWSKPLAAQLGHEVPLDTERGYNVTVARWTGGLEFPIACFERLTIMTPLDRGLRITGFVEFGGLKLPPAQARLETLKRHLNTLFPGTEIPSSSEWLGCRPSLPDHLPVIGTAADNPNAIFAFGHQHLGLTLAGITADCVAAMAAGREEPVDLQPFRIGRF